MRTRGKGRRRPAPRFVPRTGSSGPARPHCRRSPGRSSGSRCRLTRVLTALLTKHTLSRDVGVRPSAPPTTEEHVMPETRRIAIVGDAGHYVGPELARHLAARGHDLVLGDPDERLVSELEEAGAQVEVVERVRNLA